MAENTWQRSAAPLMAARKQSQKERLKESWEKVYFPRLLSVTCFLQVGLAS
jgi:hypothetical protein